MLNVSFCSGVQNVMVLCYLCIPVIINKRLIIAILRLCSNSVRVKVFRYVSIHKAFVLSCSVDVIFCIRECLLDIRLMSKYSIIVACSPETLNTFHYFYTFFSRSRPRSRACSVTLAQQMARNGGIRTVTLNTIPTYISWKLLYISKLLYRSYEKKKKFSQ